MLPGHLPGDSLTYGEWKELGFHVNKGEKSVSRNKHGIATFSPDQVDEDSLEPGYRSFGDNDDECW